MLRAPRPRAVGLKTDVYLDLARRNLWLLGGGASIENLFDLSPAEVLNTAPWRETRRGLLAPDATVPARCTACYTLNDPWRRDM